MPINNPSLSGKDPASQLWELEVTNRLNQLEYDVNNQIVVNNVASNNYDGKRSGEVFSEFENNPGTKGYYLDSNTGSAVFSNAVIRGQSVIGSASIGGDSFSIFPSSSYDDTANGQVDGDIGAYPQSGPTYVVDQTVTSFKYVTFTLPSNATNVDYTSGFIDIFSRPTTNPTLNQQSPVLSSSQYTDANMSVTVQAKYFNSGGTQVGSTISDTISGTNSTWNWITWEITPPQFQGTRVGVRRASIPYSDLTDLGSIPSGAQTLELHISITVNSSANWSIVSLNEDGNFSIENLPIKVGGDLSKPINTEAYISTSELDKFALTVEGGEGLKVGAKVLLDGGTSLVHTTADYNLTDNARMFVALLTWDDSGTNSWNNVGTATVVFTLPASGDQSLYNNDSGWAYSLFLNEINSVYGRVGTLFINANDNTGTTSLVFTNVNDYSGVSGHKIKKVWEIMSL